MDPVLSVQVDPFRFDCGWANVESVELGIALQDLEFLHLQHGSRDVWIRSCDEGIALWAGLQMGLIACAIVARPIDIIVLLEHSIWVRMVGLVDFGTL